MSVKYIQTSDDLNQMKALSKERLVVVDVFTHWCGPCKVVGPKFEKLAENYENVSFFKLDGESIFIEDFDDFVNSFPTFLYIRNNEVLNTFSGTNISQIENLVIQYS